MCTLTIGDYTDSFLFTPPSPDLADATAVVRITERKSSEPVSYEVTELPGATETGGRGRLVQLWGRYCYEI